MYQYKGRVDNLCHCLYISSGMFTISYKGSYLEYLNRKENFPESSKHNSCNSRFDMLKRVYISKENLIYKIDVWNNSTRVFKTFNNFFHFKIWISWSIWILLERDHFVKIKNISLNVVSGVFESSSNAIVL